MRAPKRRFQSDKSTVTVAVLVLLCCITVACAKDRPKSLPMVGIYNRTTAKIEVTPIVVHDPLKRRQAQDVYTEIAATVEQLAAARSASQKRIGFLPSASASKRLTQVTTQLAMTTTNASQT